MEYKAPDAPTSCPYYVREFLKNHLVSSDWPYTFARLRTGQDY
jgi:hypothetical protein